MGAEFTLTTNKNREEQNGKLLTVKDTETGLSTLYIDRADRVHLCMGFELDTRHLALIICITERHRQGLAQRA